MLLSVLLPARNSGAVNRAIASGYPRVPGSCVGCRTAARSGSACIRRASRAAHIGRAARASRVAWDSGATSDVTWPRVHDVVIRGASS